MRKSIKATHIALIVVFALLWLLSGSVYAEGIKGSIELQCHINEGENQIPLKSDTYAIVQIGNLQIETDGYVYETRQEFLAFDCDWAKLTDTERKEKAVLLETYIRENGLFEITNTTNEFGNVKFENLDTGLYLVSRVSSNQENEKYLFQSFLVEIPTVVSKNVYYDVVATPKFDTMDRSDPPRDSSSAGQGSAALSDEPIRTPSITGVPSGLYWKTAVLLVCSKTLFVLIKKQRFCLTKTQRIRCSGLFP